MGAPTIDDRVEHESTAGTTHNVVMPATVPAGKILLVTLAIYTAGLETISTPSGWTQKHHQAGGATWCRLYHFARVTDGSEGGASYNFSSSGNRSVGGVVRLLSGVEGNSLDSLEFSGAAGSVNPPSITPSWGSDPTLYMVALGFRDTGSMTVSAWPTGYVTDQQIEFYESNVNIAACASAAKTGSGAEDPSSFSATGVDHAVVTVAIRGTVDLGKPAYAYAQQ